MLSKMTEPEGQNIVETDPDVSGIERYKFEHGPTHPNRRYFPSLIGLRILQVLVSQTQPITSAALYAMGDFRPLKNPRLRNEVKDLICRGFCLAHCELPMLVVSVTSTGILELRKCEARGCIERASWPDLHAEISEEGHLVGDGRAVNPRWDALNWRGRDYYSLRAPDGSIHQGYRLKDWIYREVSRFDNKDIDHMEGEAEADVQALAGLSRLQPWRPNPLSVWRGWTWHFDVLTARFQHRLQAVLKAAKPGRDENAATLVRQANQFLLSDDFVFDREAINRIICKLMGNRGLGALGGRNRPLKAMYACVFFETISLCCGSSFCSRSSCGVLAIGVDIAGCRDPLGFWFWGETESSMAFSMRAASDLQTWGVRRIELIFCDPRVKLGPAFVNTFDRPLLHLAVNRMIAEAHPSLKSALREVALADSPCAAQVRFNKLSIAGAVESKDSWRLSTLYAWSCVWDSVLQFMKLPQAVKVVIIEETYGKFIDRRIEAFLDVYDYEPREEGVTEQLWGAILVCGAVGAGRVSGWQKARLALESYLEARSPSVDGPSIIMS